MVETAMLRYGMLPPSEAVAVPAVSPSQVDTFVSAYALWRQVTDVKGFYRAFDIDDLAEPFYSEAVRLLAPHSHVFAGFGRQGLEAALERIGRGNLRLPDGFFLSALINATEMTSLDGSFNLYALGYKLAPGKSVICRPGSSIVSLGHMAEGTIISHAKCEQAFTLAAGGFQVSYGPVSLFAHTASGGLQAYAGPALNNQSDDLLTFASGATGGVHLNVSWFEEHFFESFGGISLYLLPEMRGSDNRLFFYKDTGLSFLTENDHEEVRNSAFDAKKKESYLKTYGALMQQATDIFAVLNRGRDPEGSFAELLGHDWRRVELDILRLGRKMKRLNGSYSSWAYKQRGIA